MKDLLKVFISAVLIACVAMQHAPITELNYKWSILNEVNKK